MGTKVSNKAISLLLSVIMIVAAIPQFALNALASSGVDDFVTRCYQVAFQREPDKGGFEYWTSVINNNEMVGSTVAYSFIFSEEYKNLNRTNEEYVTDLYSMFMGRKPDQEGFAFWCSSLEGGTTRDEIFAGFANSVEFYNLCSSYGISAGSYTNNYDLGKVNSVNLFVERLYSVCLGRLGDQAGQSYWVNGLLNGELTGIGCAAGFIKSTEYENQGLNNDDYVENLYICFMGRASDDAGKAYWVGQLNNGESSRDQVFAGFANSQEFTNICANYGIERGDYTAQATTETPTTTPTPTATPTPAVDWPIDINVYSETSEVPNAIKKYAESHPEFAEHYNVVVTTARDYEYINTLETALSDNSVDLYIVEAGENSYTFINGEYSNYAASYQDLFADYDARVSAADIAQYAIDLGTRNSDGAVVGISYSAHQGLMMYRRSIATEVFGTDNPSEIEKIFGAGSGNLDLFLAAAEKLKNKGYVATSSLSDIQSMLRFREHKPYMNNGVFKYTTDLEYQLDVERQMIDNGYTNNTDAWSSEWISDMNGTSAHNVFCYMAPYWQLSGTNGNNCGDTEGDWAVCQPPMNFYQGGSYVMANKNVIGTPKEDGIRELINFLIFDTSENGYQYQYATGAYWAVEGEETTGWPVVSRVVMRNVSSTLKITGNQNIFNVIGSMENFSIITPASEYDNRIWVQWNMICTKYANGEITREEAIKLLPEYLEMVGVPI